MDRGAGGSPPRVLVTEDAPSYGVLAGVRALREGGFDPWVAVAHGKKSYSIRSRTCGGALEVPDPERDAPAYVEALAKGARFIGAATVIPGTEQAVLALVGQNQRFGEGVVLAAGEPAAVKAVTDKRKLGAIGEEVGLSPPPGILVERGRLDQYPQLSYPAVVKTPQKVTATGEGELLTVAARRVSGPAELKELLSSVPAEQFLVQPYVGTALEAVCGVAWRGEIVCSSHQVAERIFPPDAGMSAYARTIAVDPELLHQVSLLIERIGWSGMFEVQVLREGDRRCLIDFNTHLYGSLSLAVAAGLNLPAIWNTLLLGLAIPPFTYRPGVHYRNEERDAAALLTALRGREWRTVRAGLRPRRNTVHAVFNARDPLPAITSLRHFHFSPRERLRPS